VHPGHEVQLPGRARVNFRTFLLGGLDLEVYLVVLDRLWRATTEKRSATFCQEKSAPQAKSWLRLCWG